ncbi:MAG: PepSY protein, partial [Sphingomonas bacterium]|nr:PepSY protein [Sphingomonas bacterium]
MAGRATPNVPAVRRFPGYNAICRWHFYAGPFFIPFLLWLAVTGAIYLFRPRIAARIDRPYAHPAVTAAPASASGQAGRRVAPSLEPSSAATSCPQYRAVRSAEQLDRGVR